MKKLLTTLTLFALLGAVATAYAFKPGDYKGQTQWDKPITFTASKAEVTRFKIKVQYGCTDFDSFWTRENGFPALEIGEDGEFSGRFRNADGSYTSRIKGTLTGKNAQGNFSAERTYDAQGNLDPSGKVTCMVHKTKWTAKKV
jgi:hypothetical protein